MRLCVLGGRVSLPRLRVDDRDQMISKLQDASIPFAIHYPTPLHLQECFSYLNYDLGSFKVSEDLSMKVLSLPMNPFITDEEIEYIAGTILDS